MELLLLLLFLFLLQLLSSSFLLNSFHILLPSSSIGPCTRRSIVISGRTTTSSSFFVKAQQQQQQQQSCDSSDNSIIGSSSSSSSSSHRLKQHQQQRSVPTTTTTALSASSSSSTFDTNNNNNNNNDIIIMSSSPPPIVLWFQHKITITAPKRGCHLITSDILKIAGNDIQKIQIGMCNLFIQHTSASLTINENADRDVRTDMETALNKIIPESWNRDGTFKHTMEGDDDMPGHVKSSVMGVSLNIPISNGKLGLGTWQGIYLNEHRNQGGWGGGHSRNILITIQGQAK